ncbi:MAG: FeoB-associated Cys-rich membrane protein [Clostridiaceae bacterium]|nr:FeoB-associated Cys-rich membrane protein [Clostridiaceae bacterium]
MERLLALIREPIDLFILFIVVAIVAAILVYKVIRIKANKTSCDCSTCTSECPMKSEGQDAKK